VTVVIASAGYPVSPRTGDVITGAERPNILHAGTARSVTDGTLRSAGGRVLCCVGTGDSLASARTVAYALVDDVHLAGSQHRTDIAAAAIAGTIQPRRS
jgi:phosphoribosylamine--glycine ligase